MTDKERGRYENKIKRQANAMAELKKERDEGLRELESVYGAVIGALVLRTAEKGVCEISFKEIKKAFEKYDVKVDAVPDRQKYTIECKKKKS